MSVASLSLKADRQDNFPNRKGTRQEIQLKMTIK